MIRRGDKKGSHVEVIISFIIFVTFIFFLFTIVEPSIGAQKDKKNIVDNLEAGIMERISAEMTTVTIKVGSTSQNCVEINGELANLGIGPRIVVKGSSGESLNCYVSSGNLQIARANTFDNFLKIYYSDAFPQVGTSAASCQILQKGSGYFLGLTKTNNYIFETKMLDLLNENYKTLKDSLKVPEGVNFGYGIVLSNGTSFETEEKELSTNIYLREKSIEYVDSKGNILVGALKIIIW